MAIVDLLESGHDASVQSLHKDGAEHAHMGYQDHGGSPPTPPRSTFGGICLYVEVTNIYLPVITCTISKYARLLAFA